MNPKNTAFTTKHLAYRQLAVMVMAATALFTASSRVAAQGDTITITAPEFQRMVYSAHLMTQIDEKPELEACLQVLLEIQRRNPQAAPADLAGLSRHALERYRTNAPSYIRSNGFSDETLAAYLEAVQDVTDRTIYAPAILSLLYSVTGLANTPTNSWRDPLLHSGTQRLLTAEQELSRRTNVVGQCTLRARGNIAFAQCMDSLLWSETGVSLGHSPSDILNINTNLGNSLTMQEMLSLRDSDNNVHISIERLKELFALEMMAMRQTISNNLATQQKIAQTQSNLPEYMANTNLVTQNLQEETQVKQGQAQRIASSHAAVNMLGDLAEGKEPALGAQIKSIGNAVNRLATCLQWMNKAEGNWVGAGIGLNVVSIGLELVGTFLPQFLPQQPTPEEVILGEIREVKKMIGDLSTNVNYRFDRVDLSLSNVLSQVSYSIDLIERTDQNVNIVRQGLLDVQVQLNRIERSLLTFQQEEHRLAFHGDLYDHLRYEQRWAAPMPLMGPEYSYQNAEANFYQHAVTWAPSESLSPVSTRNCSPEGLYYELTSRTNHAEDLNYIKKYFRTQMGLSSFNSGVSSLLANPQDWNAGAGAWLQLALENPTHFRNYPGAVQGLNDIIGLGQDLSTFFRDLTFTSGTSVNWPLYHALLTNYSVRLETFTNLVHATELSPLSLQDFPLNTWRQRAVNGRRITASNTVVQPLPLYAQNVSQIAAGFWHSLALRDDGTVVAWGAGTNNLGMPHFGQAMVPTDLTNVKMIAAGCAHSLALMSNGTVRAWGYNATQQTIVPEAATNVQEIAAGYWHNVALRADGTVVGWGDALGMANAPSDLSNVVTVAAGGQYSLALRADGTVVGWGLNDVGQATGVTNGAAGPVMIGDSPLTNVCAIAAGHYHSLALQSNGMVIAWGAGTNGQTTVPSAATNGVVAIAAGANHSLAVKTDGTVIAWGLNDSYQSMVPRFLGAVVAIAAGETHSLALKTDGTVVGWGNNINGQSTPPGTPPGGAVAIAGGESHNLALLANGRVLGWGYGAAANGASAGANVVAIAAGKNMSLAITGDGTLVGWGGASVASGTRAVAIAAGLNHFIALTPEGSILAWGDNSHGQLNVPGRGTWVAIAAGWNHNLALGANGTIMGWGYDAGDLAPPAVVQGQVVQGHAVAIAAGRWHSLALLDNGKVVAWGNNTHGGQLNIDQTLNNNVVAIAAGSTHSLALKKDGTVFGWGNNNSGEVSIPAGLNNVVAIAAGGLDDPTDNNHGRSLALKADGTVVSWGDNSWNIQANVPWDLRRYESYAEASKQAKGTLTNATSSQFNGSLTGNPVWVRGTDSVPGSALSFDGTDDSVLVPGFGQQLPTDEVTVEFWQRARKLGYQSTFGLEPDDANNRFQAHIPWIDGMVYWDFGGGRVSYRPSVSPLNTWQHFALVAKSGSDGFLGIYRNGVLEASNQHAALVSSPFANKSLRLGCLYNGVFNFAGELDEFRIWKKVRTQDEIVANMTNRLAGTETDLVAYWTFDDGPGPSVPQLLTGIKKVAAGRDYSVALRSDGTVVAYGLNTSGQCTVPTWLSGVADIAAGHRHCLALRDDGTVVGWGSNAYGEADASGLNNVVAIAAGGTHSLVLRGDGSVVGLGCNNAGQTNVPNASLRNKRGDNSVVAIAAGAQHSIALKADTTVVTWGGAIDIATVPIGLSNVVAIAAGDWHNLALRSDGSVTAWGRNSFGQTTVPTEAAGSVVAIAANGDSSYALKQDGTVIAWGRNTYGQTNLPSGLNNVVAIAPGWRHSLFLRSEGQSSGAENGGVEFILPNVPTLITKEWLPKVSANLLAQLDLGGGNTNLYPRAVELSGAKALLKATLELGMPYTMERDDFLHSFFYGTEALSDIDVVKGLFQADVNTLSTIPNARPLVLENIVWSRYTSFSNRLHQCLTNLQATGQPELPRMVGHTMRLLHLLNDAWSSSPSPVLELGRNTNALRLVLYGEPYAHYTLQYRDNLSTGDWSSTSTTNHNEQVLTNTLPLAPSTRYYRMLRMSAP